MNNSFLMLGATLRKPFTLNISKKRKINLTCSNRFFIFKSKICKHRQPHSVSFKNSWNIYLNKTHVIILMTFVSLGIYMLLGFIGKLRTFLVKLNIDLKLSLYMYFISVFLTNISVIDTCISLNRRCSLQSVKSGTFYLSSPYVFSKKKNYIKFKNCLSLPVKMDFTICLM